MVRQHLRCKTFAPRQASVRTPKQACKADAGDARLLEPVTERIIGCAFRVANALGHGFVEKVYENVLAHVMRKYGLGVVQQRGIVVFYDDVIVGEYTAGLLVEDQVIVELKVAGALSGVHVPQCRNYLRATGKPLCLLINFGRPKVEIRRGLGTGRPTGFFEPDQQVPHHSGDLYR